MKSVATRKKLPATPAEWESLIAAAPGKDRPLTAAEEREMADAVVVKVSVRYSPEVLQYFKASGSGWQTRMNEALLEWINKRSPRSRRGA